MSTRETRRVLADLGLPETCLLVLLGASGSGKSTVASLFPPASVLSADRLREVLTGDPGDQEASRTAWNQLDAQLDSRLRHQVPTVVDAVNSEQWVRLKFTAIAHHRGVPAIALIVDADLATALERNARRPANLRVPAEVVLAQHAELTAALPDLVTVDGFDAVHHARDLPVMTALVGAAARREERHPHLDVERVFGRELARAFTWHDERDAQGFRTGAFAVAGQELTVRWMDDAEPFHASFETPAASPCPDCEGTAWLPVHSANELSAALHSTSAYEPRCPDCF
ncbi:ATP-binding protein [Kitasatospora griseola]|uniref:ATP-binding protein n=1 Tax=Kitasatospora griseola TaxID=2064 RepID=UPI003443A75A